MEITFRLATPPDLPLLVAMLADDPLGATREQYAEPLPEPYHAAFAAIERDENNELLLACWQQEIVGFLQITYIPYLTHVGGWRALVEGVRVHKNHRGAGLGRTLLTEAIRRARTRHCHLVQLTTDKQRPDAIAFYQSLGFVASHEGMKLRL